MKKPTIFIISLFCMLTFLYSQAPVSDKPAAKIWQESVALPTYLVDDPDPNPRFYDGRAYQGAQGRVYPYPIYESLSDTRVMKDYDLVFLENEYIKIDRQHVVKPALIGMLGAWISGGIEWNFPHHHRATAYMPVDYTMVENPDGSATLWIGELEIRHRMKFMLGLTVYPGKSYFEVTFRPFNRTPFAHSFLYFANTGVHTNEQYQVLFPPATQFGTYHGKNQFVHWPMADEVYNRVDYTGGVDISWWKNHPEWTSIFCWNYEDDFVGGYDHGKEAGILCFSNHHIAPGKKFWTWSTGPRGQMWDLALTETDGPELEIMIGGYSDNQPDYSWLQPYESKYLKQYFYPIRELKSIKNANLEAAVNLERIAGNRVLLAFNTTAERKSAKVVLQAGDQIIYEAVTDIDPSRPFSKEVLVPEGIKDTEIKVSLFSSTGLELISYRPVEPEEEPMPEAAVPPKPPAEIETVEELYMTGLRLEQFYNPSFRPEPYYQEALARDPSNYRVNLAVGLQYLRKGIYELAEDHLKVAVKRITNNHTKPRDGEACYYLGLCQQYMGKHKEAYKNLYQATWSQAFHSAAYLQLAQLDCKEGNYETALVHLDRSLTTNHCNTRAWGLKSTALRKIGNTERALEISQATEKNDHLDIWSGFEIHLCHAALGNSLEADQSLESIKNRFQDYVQTYLELSLDYANAGCWEDAIKVLTVSGTSLSQEEREYPLLDYYLGYYHQQQGDHEQAMEHYRRASGRSPDYCFPFRLESIRILEAAIKANPEDAMARYYLGNLLFEMQPERAITLWEEASEMGSDFPTLYRNLGWAYYKIRQDIPGAIMHYEKAVALDNKDQRLLYELDLVYADGRVSPEKRLKILQDNHQAIADNNVSDALSREVMLLVQLGRYDEALEVANNNYFRQWEGVSKAYSSYVDAHLLRGWESFQQGRIQEALEDYLAALVYPANMMVAEPYRGGRSAEVHYFIGTAYEKLGDLEEAMDHYREAATKRQHQGLSEIHFYKALALKKLEKNEEAGEIFQGLISLGRKRLQNPEEDFFAKFGEKQTADDQKADAYFLVGLGYLGQGENMSAQQEFTEAVKLNVNHIWAAALLSQIKTGTAITLLE
jgi:tetratricopeptide (TPR) repeat protein